MLVAAGLVDRVGDRGHQFGGAFAELPGQDREGGLPVAAVGDVVGVVFDRVVQQGGACHVGVGDAVVAEDPDRDPQRMAVMPTSA